MAGRPKTMINHMAITKRQAEGVRAAIQTTNIVQRLQRHINDECEMKPTQIKAAEILLDRVLPRLQAVAVDAGNSIDLMTLLTEARNRVLATPVHSQQVIDAAEAEMVEGEGRALTGGDD